MTDANLVQKDNYSFDDFDFLELNKIPNPNQIGIFQQVYFEDSYGNFSDDTQAYQALETNIFKPTIFTSEGKKPEINEEFGCETSKTNKKTGKKKKKTNSIENSDTSEATQLNKRRCKWRIASRNYREKMKKVEEKLDNDILLVRILNKSIISEIRDLKVVLKNKSNKKYFQNP